MQVHEQKVNIPFYCELKFPDETEPEKWEGVVDRVTNYGSHVMFHVKARGSGFNVIAGRYIDGTFMVIGTYSAGFHLADPSDIFYNKEAVLREATIFNDHGHINPVDGTSAVYAFRALNKAGLFTPPLPTDHDDEA